MSAWVYILRLNSGKYCIGSTGDIDRRFQEHISGKSPYTSKFLPVELVFKKELLNLTEAIKLERKFKKFKSRILVEKIIESGRAVPTF